MIKVSFLSLTKTFFKRTVVGDQWWPSSERLLGELLKTQSSLARVFHKYLRFEHRRPPQFYREGSAKTDAPVENNRRVRFCEIPFSPNPAIVTTANQLAKTLYNHFIWRHSEIDKKSISWIESEGDGELSEATRRTPAKTDRDRSLSRFGRQLI